MHRFKAVITVDDYQDVDIDVVRAVLVNETLDLPLPGDTWARVSIDEAEDLDARPLPKKHPGQTEIDL